MKNTFRLMALALMAVAVVSLAGCKKDDDEVTRSDEHIFSKGVLNISLISDTVSCTELAEAVHNNTELGSTVGENILGHPDFTATMFVILNGDTNRYPIATGSPVTFNKAFTFTKLPQKIKAYISIEHQPSKDDTAYYSLYYHTEVTCRLVDTRGGYYNACDSKHDVATTGLPASFVDEFIQSRSNILYEQTVTDNQ